MLPPPLLLSFFFFPVVLVYRDVKGNPVPLPREGNFHTVYPLPSSGSYRAQGIVFLGPLNELTSFTSHLIAITRSARIARNMTPQGKVP